MSSLTRRFALLGNAMVSIDEGAYAMPMAGAFGTLLGSFSSSLVRIQSTSKAKG